MEKVQNAELQSIILYFIYLIIKYLYYTKNTCIILSCIIQRQTIVKTPSRVLTVQAGKKHFASSHQQHREKIALSITFARRITSAPLTIDRDRLLPQLLARHRASRFRTTSIRAVFRQSHNCASSTDQLLIVCQNYIVRRRDQNVASAFHPWPRRRRTPQRSSNLTTHGC